MSGHGKVKVGIVLQITAMVMLLCLPHLPFLTPSLSVRGQPGRCAMDHRICGCAPERIASRTCCCFRSMKVSEVSAKHGQCALNAKPHEHPNQADATPPVHRLSCKTCGQDPRTIPNVTSDMKYLCSTQVPLPMDRSAPCDILPMGDSYLNPSMEPQVPPPKISILV